MSLVLSAHGGKCILSWYFKKKDYNNPFQETNNGFYLRMYTNPHVPTVDSTISDFVEAQGGGYSQKYIDRFDWAMSYVNGIATCTGKLQRWDFTGPLNGGAQVVGLYLVDALGNFIGAEKAPYFYTPEERAVYEVLPVVLLGNADIEPPVIHFFGYDDPGVDNAELIVHLTVSDNIKVVEYALSEDPQNFIWRTWKPYDEKSYIFTSDGTKTLYALVKDEMGNVSNMPSITVDIVVPDNTVPTITEFTIPSLSVSLTIPVTLTATDNKEIGGYAISEVINDPGTFSPTPPTEYSFLSGGPKILYAFVRDASGNTTLPLSRAVTVTYSDVAIPSITTFSIPATSPSLTVPITLEATDDIAVAEYSLNETNQPGTWTAEKPTEYTFASEGLKTLYAFVRDYSGNVSQSHEDTVNIDVTDFSAPVITEFTIPATSASLTVPITSLVASDDVAVVKYSINEVDAPAVWTATPPTDYTFTSQGSKTLYVFVKDVADNISVSASASVDVLIPDTEAPVITNFVLPPTSETLTVPVTLIASDNEAIKDYSLNTVPTPGAWLSVRPMEYTFPVEGANTLYAWVRDYQNNVSVMATASVIIAIPDVEKPVVTSFVMPYTSYFLTVPITSFEASDNVLVEYYSVNDVNLPSQWFVDKPTKYTFNSPGIKTLYAFARDVAGNISVAASQTVTITFPQTLIITFDDGTYNGADVEFVAEATPVDTPWAIDNSSVYAGSNSLQSPFPSDGTTWHRMKINKPSVGGSLAFWLNITDVGDNFNFRAYYTVNGGPEIDIIDIDKTPAGWQQAVATVPEGWIDLYFQVTKRNANIGNSKVTIDNLVIP